MATNAPRTINRAAYRYNADGSVVCPHRDLSACPDCVAADDYLVNVYGAVYLAVDPDERDDLLAMTAEDEAAAWDRATDTFYADLDRLT
jgi:hypothetical protein